jgi:hypothetical protein
MHIAAPLLVRAPLKTNSSGYGSGRLAANGWIAA